jgi:hypothetical protein
MPVDYPRINQFQEWFTIDEAKQYSVISSSNKQSFVSGKRLKNGLRLDVRSSVTIMLEIQ